MVWYNCGMKAEQDYINKIKKSLEKSESFDVFVDWGDEKGRLRKKQASFSAKDLEEISANVTKIFCDYERDMNMIEQEWEQRRAMV